VLSSVEEQIEHGRTVVTDGGLRMLRERLGLTRGAIADMLQTDVVTYTGWEKRPDTALWRATAARIGRFHVAAWRALGKLEEIEMDINLLHPLHVAASVTGVPQEVLLQWYREDRLPGEDLGVLGVWLYRDNLGEVNQIGDWD